MADFPWGNLITAISTLLGVFIANGLNGGRSQNERLWALKQEAYSSVIASTKRLVDRMSVALVDQQGLSVADWPEMNAINAQVHVHLDAVFGKFAEHYLLFSVDVHQIFSDLGRELTAFDSATLVSRGAARDLFDRASQDMEKIARSELGLELVTQPGWAASLKKRFF